METGALGDPDSRPHFNSIWPDSAVARESILGQTSKVPGRAQPACVGAMGIIAGPGFMAAPLGQKGHGGVRSKAVDHRDFKAAATVSHECDRLPGSTMKPEHVGSIELDVR